MKRVIFLACMLIFIQISVFCQSIDMPNWMEGGMSLEEIQRALRQSKIILDKSNDTEICYFYWDNHICYHFDVDPYYGLEFYYIYAKKGDLDFQNVLSSLTRKYGIPEYNIDEYIWYIELGDYFIDIILYEDYDEYGEWINIEYQFW